MGSDLVATQGNCRPPEWERQQWDVPGGGEISELSLQVTDFTEKLHVQILLLLQLVILFHQPLSEALQQPTVSHLWSQLMKDLHVLHIMDLVQT